MMSVLRLGWSNKFIRLARHSKNHKSLNFYLHPYWHFVGKVMREKKTSWNFVRNSGKKEKNTCILLLGSLGDISVKSEHETSGANGTTNVCRFVSHADIYFSIKICQSICLSIHVVDVETIQTVQAGFCLIKFYWCWLMMRPSKCYGHIE